MEVGPTTLHRGIGAESRPVAVRAPRIWPLGESWIVLNLKGPVGRPAPAVAVRATHVTGACPSLLLTVFALGAVREGAVPVGSFGGSYDCLDLDGTPLFRITGGSMRLNDQWRGLHIGTWCQNEVVKWVRSRATGRTHSLRLAVVDGLDPANRARRSRFYEQFGINFDWLPEPEGGFEARSIVQPTNELVELGKVAGVIELDMRTALQGACEAAERSARQTARLNIEAGNWLAQVRVLELQLGKRTSLFRPFGIGMLVGLGMGAAVLYWLK